MYNKEKENEETELQACQQIFSYIYIYIYHISNYL